MSKCLQKVLVFFVSIFLSVLLPFQTVAAEGMLVDWVKIGQPARFEEVEITPAPEGFEYDFSTSLDSAWKLFNWQLSRANGYLYFTNTSFGTHGCYRYIDNDDIGDDMVLETRMMFPQWGEGCGMYFRFGDRIIYLHMRESDLFIDSTHSSYVADEIDFSNPEKWYEIKVETYDRMERARIYVDGKCVADMELSQRETDEPGQSMIQFFATNLHGAYTKVNIDWVKYTPITYSDAIQVSAVEEDGQILLSAAMQDGSTPDSVEYFLYGNRVAVGHFPEYHATLTGLPAGSYQLSARAGGQESSEVAVTIPPRLSAEITANQVGSQLSLSLSDLKDEAEQIASVAYLMDGEFVAESEEAPYTVSTSYLPESHTITAILKGEGGVVLKEISQSWQPELGASDISRNYANEISYTVSGTTGNATVTIGNGVHLVSMVHTKDEVTYVTSEGSKSYPVGAGEFKVLTDGPFAEVYCNGQLAFSYLMERNSTPQNSVSENGMQVEKFSIIMPEERNNYFVKRNLGVEESAYSLSCDTAWNNMDFIATDTTAAEFTFSDGYYFTKISLENGKIYAWTVFEEKSVSEKKEVAVMPAGNVFYRVEMGGGMIRLYGDGKWLASFRGMLATGSPELGIRITNGGVGYLAVNDCADIYFYEDSFDGTGAASSYDFWHTTGVEADVKQETGVMTLDAEKIEDGIAELHAFSGEVFLSTELTLSKCNGGFWFLLGHSIEEEYAKVGYNAATGRFEVVVAEGDDTSVSTTTLYETEGILPINQKISLSLKVQSLDAGREISLFADGELVLRYYEDAFESPALHRGKVGFMLSKCVADLDSISYRGDAKPLLSVNGNNALANNSSTFDVIENEDGLVLVGDGNYLYTKNAGKSWRMKTASNLQGCDIVQLANGKYLSIKMVYNGNTVSFVSAISDDGITYTQIGTVSGSQTAVTTTGNRVYQGESGKIYFIRANPSSESHGSLTICCSEDNGVNWYEWKTFTSDELGGTIHEAKLIELENENCRLYFRSEFGSVVAVDYDAEEDTWTTEPQMLPMFASANCFNVEQDVSQRNVLYMGWSYDNANVSGKIQYPRSRWAIARSDDYGENWVFIGTTMEYTRAESTVQNMNINITDDYIIHNANAIADSANVYGGRYFVLDRNKQVGTHRFEQLHLLYPTQMEEQAVVSPQQKRETLTVNTNNHKILYSDWVMEDMSDSIGILLDFNSGDFIADGNFSKSYEITFDSSNGLNLDGGQLRYTPMDYYTPIIPGERYVCFTAKVEAGQSMQLLFQDPEGGSGRASFVVTPEGVSKLYGISQTVTTDFAPGNGWVDYMLAADVDAVKAASLYAKVEGGWQKVAQVQGYDTTSGGPATGLYFTGTGCIRDAVIYGDDGTGTKVAIASDGGAEMLVGVSPYLLANMIGATPEFGDDGYVSFRIADGEVLHQILTHGEEQYLDLNDFSETYGFNLVCKNGLNIVGNFDDWSSRAIRAMKIATDPFAGIN